MTRIVLGTARCLAKRQTLIARPHLTREVPGKHAELKQPSSSCQTWQDGAGEEGLQEGRSGSLVRGPGVHFGL